jgi:18S rRNA (guanine1575-N7)-methyltransferase
MAQKAGFGGGIVVDYPNSKKAKKVFLCLLVGGGGGGGGQQQQLPKGLETEDERVPFERRREKEKKRDRSGKRKSVKDRDWILKKKKVSPSVLATALC